WIAGRSSVAPSPLAPKSRTLTSMLRCSASISFFAASRLARKSALTAGTPSAGLLGSIALAMAKDPRSGGGIAIIGFCAYRVNPGNQRRAGALYIAGGARSVLGPPAHDRGRPGR